MRCLKNVLWNACGFVFADDQRPGIGGIKHVFAEQLADLGLAFLNGGETFFGRAGELSAGQHKITQSEFAGVLLFVVQCGGVYGFVFGVQGFVGT